MGASQNQTDKDVDRKANFFLLTKYFLSSRTNLFIWGWGGRWEEYLLVCRDWARLSLYLI